ncbi:MAG: beta-lactamase family protein [Clostridia bacterium]|nr:beta-lactamase family protein [Clostridia bacterium]
MSDFLRDAAAFIREKNYNIYSIAEICDGGEAESICINPANAAQNSYSVAKVFTVTAIGLLCDRGLISTDALVCDILSRDILERTRERMDGRWESVTVDMAMRHALGLPRGFLDIDCTDPRAFGEDYLAYMLEYPLVSDHGGERSYTDGAYYLLARVCERIAGEPLDKFLWRELFSRLGFREVAWSKCPCGHCMGATGLYITTEDMVKLGEVYRSGGLYRGERILSEEWVRTVFSRGYELRMSGFAEGYCKSGMLGQMLAIFPKQNRVVAWHGHGFREQNELMYFISRYDNS